MVTWNNQLLGSSNFIDIVRGYRRMSNASYATALRYHLRIFSHNLVMPCNRNSYFFFTILFIEFKVYVAWSLQLEVNIYFIIATRKFDRVRRACAFLNLLPWRHDIFHRKNGNIVRAHTHSINSMNEFVQFVKRNSWAFSFAFSYFSFFENSFFCRTIQLHYGSKKRKINMKQGLRTHTTVTKMMETGGKLQLYCCITVT